MAVLTNNNDFASANWVPYCANVTVDLGSVDGQQNFLVRPQGPAPNACLAWVELPLTRDTAPPLIVVTNPTATTLSQPLIQLQEYCI